MAVRGILSAMFQKRPDTIIESCVDVSAEESDPFAVHGTDAISIKDAIIVRILFVITIILFRFSSMSYLREDIQLFAQKYIFKLKSLPTNILKSHR